jgi:hypothetical protein
MTTSTYLDRTIAGAISDLKATTGSRNATLFTKACHLYAFSEAGCVPETDLTSDLETTGRDIGLTAAEIRDTLRSARKRAAGIDEGTRQELRAKCGGQGYTRQPQPDRVTAPEACEPPCAQWQATGQAFVDYAQCWMDEPAHAYLHGRGLTGAAIAAAQLGYNPTGRWSERAKWGLPIERDGNVRLWLPQGIVIPWYVGGALWKISIRKLHTKPGEKAYKTLPGSSNALYNADALRAGQPAMLVEGVFDALSVQQEAGDLIAPVACGTSGARRARWIAQLALSEPILNSLDADAAGDDCHYWMDALAPLVRSWRPYWDDPSKMLQDGADVRQWVLAGLGRAAAPWTSPDAAGLWVIVRDYWRGEVRAGSGALERLRRRCEEQGWDYGATVEALHADL